MSKYQNINEEEYNYVPDCSSCYYYPLNFDDEPCSMCRPGSCFYTNTVPNTEKGEEDVEKSGT